jgi:hypothetical protein
MRIEWLGVAEAAVADARGAMTLVGVNQNVTLAKELPVRLNRAVVVLAVDDSPADDAAGEVRISLTLRSPEGDELAKQETALEVTGKRFADLPGSIQLTLDLQAEASSFGTYVVECALEANDSEPVTATRELYVLRAE